MNFPLMEFFQLKCVFCDNFTLTWHIIDVSCVEILTESEDRMFYDFEIVNAKQMYALQHVYDE